MDACVNAAEKGSYIGLSHDSSCKVQVYCFSRDGKSHIDVITNALREEVGNKFTCLEISDVNTIIYIAEDDLSYEKALQILEANPSPINGVPSKPMEELEIKKRKAA